MFLEQVVVEANKHGCSANWNEASVVRFTDRYRLTELQRLCDSADGTHFTYCVLVNRILEITILCNIGWKMFL